ncbi:MAG: hypothetical protein RLO17_23755 [Cyclobacteriaceae bacterium]|jgi:hypothetical protein|tara:strand:+ start:414 stop:686 length:273 start_codon:yes stop_codon:yes gene_type:complete
MQENKLNIKVLIENDQLFEGEFVVKQPVQVIVNRAVAHLKIQPDGRELRREDGTPITNLSAKIEEVGIYNNETLRFFEKSDKPDRDKRFA